MEDNMQKASVLDDLVDVLLDPVSSIDNHDTDKPTLCHHMVLTDGLVFLDCYDEGGPFYGMGERLYPIGNHDQTGLERTWANPVASCRTEKVLL